MKLKILVLGIVFLLPISFEAKEKSYKYNYVFPELVSTIGTNEKDILEINDFDIDVEGKIFIAEGSENQIVVYSPGGERLYAFGSKGQGPGEFISPYRICLHDNKVYVVDVGNRRIQILNKTGDYLNSFKIPEKVGAGVRYLGYLLGDKLFFNGYSHFMTRAGKEKLWQWIYTISGIDGNNFTHFLNYTTFEAFEPGYTESGFRAAYGKAANDKIFIPDNGKDIKYRLFIYSISGEKLKEIEKKYKLRKIPIAMKDFMKKRIESYKKSTFLNPMGGEWKLQILFPEHVPAIKDIAIDGDRLLVRTWLDWWQAIKKEKDNSKIEYEIDVYSTSGDYLGRGITNLDLQGTVFSQDFVYEKTRIPPYYETVIHVYKRTK